MGFSVVFNWALKIDVPADLVVGEVYKFVKGGNRVFPIKTPIDLINSERDAIAKIRILEFKNIESETSGKYKVIKMYSGEEQKVLNNYWLENQ